ncbi:MAG: MBL fold metallo-hydrolase [Gammaproteobacteria bacterium]
MNTRVSLALIPLLAAFLSPVPVLAQSPSGDACEPGRYAPVDVDMKLRRASEHVYHVQGTAGMATDNAGFISNAGFVLTPDGVYVFDALGSPSLAYKLYGLIRGVTDLPIKAVIVSHYHADHIYGLQVFKDMGAEIIAPRAAHEYLDSEAAVSRLDERRFSLDPWVNDCTRLVPPDVNITESRVISAGDMSLRILFLGSAHSQGDLALLVEPDQVLLSGDIIFEGRVPFVGDADTKQWLKVLTEMQTDGLKALIPGHGPTAKKPNEAITLTRDYLAVLRGKLAEAVDNLVPFSEVYDEIDWSAFAHLPAFEAANRRNAYQVYLSIEAESVGR